MIEFDMQHDDNDDGVSPFLPAVSLVARGAGPVRIADGFDE